jgi:hypothetical protein
VPVEGRDVSIGALGPHLRVKSSRIDTQTTYRLVRLLETEDCNSGDSGLLDFRPRNGAIVDPEDPIVRSVLSRDERIFKKVSDLRSPLHIANIEDSITRKAFLEAVDDESAEYYCGDSGHKITDFKLWFASLNIHVQLRRPGKPVFSVRNLDSKQKLRLYGYLTQFQEKFQDMYRYRFHFLNVTTDKPVYFMFVGRHKQFSKHYKGGDDFGEMFGSATELFRDFEASGETRMMIVYFTNGHATGCIIDKLEGDRVHSYFIDTNGNGGDTSHCIDMSGEYHLLGRCVHEYFGDRDLGGKDVVPNIVSEDGAVQGLQSQGTCALWSGYILWLAAVNPDIRPDVIVRRVVYRTLFAAHTGGKTYAEFQADMPFKDNVYPQDVTWQDLGLHTEITVWNFGLAIYEQLLCAAVPPTPAQLKLDWDYWKGRFRDQDGNVHPAETTPELPSSDGVKQLEVGGTHYDLKFHEGVKAMLLGYFKDHRQTDTVVTLLAPTNKRVLERFVNLENAARLCLNAGVWSSKAPRSHVGQKPGSVEHDNSDVQRRGHDAQQRSSYGFATAAPRHVVRRLVTSTMRGITGITAPFTQHDFVQHLKQSNCLRIIGYDACTNPKSTYRVADVLDAGVFKNAEDFIIKSRTVTLRK